MGTSFCWGLTCDGLMSCPGGVIDSQPLDTTETRDKHRPYESLGSGKDLVIQQPNDED